MLPFQIGTGSIMGETHRSLWYNNQDALRVSLEHHIIVGVVCDGCGSSHSSEVGAILTSEFTMNFCQKYFAEGAFIEPMLRNGICNMYEKIAKEVAPANYSQFIQDTFLCTIVGFVITKQTTTIFSSGDGIWCVNDEWQEIDQNNRPDFLAYQLTHGNEHPFTVKQYESSKVSRLMIATDGLGKLFRHESDGGRVINDLFERDEFFEHPAALNKFLSHSKGLRDDTSVVMVRKMG